MKADQRCLNESSCSRPLTILDTLCITVSLPPYNIISTVTISTHSHRNMSRAPPPKLRIKRPVAHREDSALDLNHTAAERLQVLQPQIQIHTQQQSRLFRLPYELRLMIYELAVPTTALPHLLASNPDHRPLEDSATEPAFLATCHLARQEALAIYYTRNDFYLNRLPSLDYQHPLSVSMNPSLLVSKAKRSNGSRWLYSMPTTKITRIRSVVLAQLGRGMYKDTSNTWRRDASAAFRIRFLNDGQKRRCEGKSWEVVYLRIDGSGGSDRYAERMFKALEMRMEAMPVKEGQAREWTRQDIWDLAYLL
ncbi:hypothetical protein BDV97DRAFT_83680 [Delphinella strobiligena]|nr:hypothetical protein BDV97DRAFT_83680 [Delphinella strobiligena]